MSTDAGRSRLFMAALMSATLGLAPLSPEPHLLGKLRWVAGGAVGMTPLDWGDLLMHGAPWLWLAAELALAAARLRSRR